jgi:hypothetical protein
MWAEDYDRDNRRFAIQTDLAQKIASSLRRNYPGRKRTAGSPANTEFRCLFAFIQAHDYANKMDSAHFKGGTLRATIKLDPNFALLCRTLNRRAGYHNRPDLVRGKKRANANKRYDCSRSSQGISRSVCYYYGDRDYDRALKEMKSPSRTCRMRLSTRRRAIQRRQGKWTESTANLRKSCRARSEKRNDPGPTRFELHSLA